jgi:hypothetical protein
MAAIVKSGNRSPLGWATCTAGEEEMESGRGLLAEIPVHVALKIPFCTLQKIHLPLRATVRDTNGTPPESDTASISATTQDGTNGDGGSRRLSSTTLTSPEGGSDEGNSTSLQKHSHDACASAFAEPPQQLQISSDNPDDGVTRQP